MEMLERDHIAREEDAAQWDGSDLISQLAISDELDENMLTAQQRAEFHRALRQGRLGALVTAWRPWWAAATGVPVQTTAGRADADQSDGDDSNALRLVRGSEYVPCVMVIVFQAEDDAAPRIATPTVRPPLPKDVPPLSTLLKAQPSPLLPVHLVQIMYDLAENTIC